MVRVQGAQAWRNNMPARQSRFTMCVLLCMFCCIGSFPATGLAQQVYTTNYTAFSGFKYSFSYYLSGTNIVRHGPFTEFYRNFKIWNQGTYQHGKRTGEWLNNTSDKTNEVNYILYTYADDRKLEGVQYKTNQIITLMRFDPSRPPAANYADMPAWQEARTYRDSITSHIYKRQTVISVPVFEGSTNFYYKHLMDQEYYDNGMLHYEQPQVYYLEPSPVMKKTGWQKEGAWRTFFSDGLSANLEEWSEGVKHGVLRSWHYPATMTAESFFRWGRLHGTCSTWFTNGLPASVGNYCASTPYSDTQYGIGLSYTYSAGIYGWTLIHVSTNDYGPSLPPYVIGGPPPDPPPPDPGEPDEPNKSIYGMVCNAKTGARLGGVSVSAGGASATTDTNGFYSVSVGNVESVNAQFSKSGYLNAAGQVSLRDAQSVVHNVSMISTASDSAITDVTSEYGMIFLGGISVNNSFNAAADWRGSSPGSVIFVMNGVSRTLTANASGASTSYDMGYDLKSAFDLRANTLEVYSRNEAGERSTTAFVVHPIVVPVPKWSTKLGPFSSTFNDGVVTYKLAAQYPEKPLAIEINPEQLGTVLWAAWGLVPVVGGQSFGIPPSQVGVDVSLNSKGKGSVGGSGKMAFKAAGGEVEVTLSGKGLVAYDMVGNAGFEWKGAELGGGVKGTIKRQYGPVTVIPALAGAIALPIIGRPVSWFNNRAKIDASVSLGGDLKFNLVNNSNDEITFKSTEGTLSSGVELGLGGDMGKVKARVSGGGTVALTYQLPASPNYLKEAKAEVTARLKLSAWSYETAFENSKSLIYPSAGGASMPMNMPAAAPAGFRLLDTSFVKVEPYAQFHDHAAARIALAALPTSSNEVPLISNIFPYAEPAFATHGTNLAVIFVGYDPAKPVTQGNELWFSRLQNGSWSSPAVLTSDTHNDYAPSAAYTADGKLLVAWERVRTNNFTSGNIQDLPPQLEIAWAVYDGASGVWSSPEFLTNDSSMDFAPVLARAPDGALALCWMKSPGGQLIGTSAQPLSLQTAIWQGSGFGTLATHPHAFSNAFDFSFAYDGQNIKVAWIQDADDDLTTIEDQRLYLSNRDASGWDAPSAPFPGEGSAAGPSLIAMSTNRWELFWQQTSNLVRMSNWDPAAHAIVRTNSAGFGFANLRFSRGSGDRIMMYWVDLQDENPDIYARIYDAGVWSEDLRLTESEGRESAVSGSFCADDTLRFLYTRERTNQVTDLFYAGQPLYRNLTAAASGSAFVPGKPVLGEAVTITSTVANTGNLSVSGLTAAFYLDAPDQGGVLIGEVAVQPTVLAAGATGTATLVNWTVPMDIGLKKVHVVFDSGGQIGESNEGDNAAVLSPVWLDLAVTDVTVSEPDSAGNLVITGTFENRGNAVANAVGIKASIDGALVGTNTLPILLPGLKAEHMWMSTSIDFISTQNTVRVEVDPSALLPDIGRENNAAEIIINRTTDRSSAGDGISDDWKRQYFGHVMVDAGKDDDGDGQSNWQEFVAGTHPRDGASVFRASLAPLDNSGRWIISWPGSVQRRYQVFRTENLLDEWVPLKYELTAWTTGTMFMFDDAATNCPRAFYLLKLIK